MRVYLCHPPGIGAPLSIDRPEPESTAQPSGAYRCGWWVSLRFTVVPLDQPL
jgi:hypothetical protein